MVKSLGLHKADNGAIYRISINPATGKKMCRIVKGATKAGMKRIAKKTTKGSGAKRAPWLRGKSTGFKNPDGTYRRLKPATPFRGRCRKGGNLKSLMRKVNRAAPRSVKRAGVNLAVGALNSQVKRYVPKQYHGYVDQGTQLARTAIRNRTGYGIHRNLTKEEQILADQALEIAKQKMYHGSGFRMTIPR